MFLSYKYRRYRISPCTLLLDPLILCGKGQQLRLLFPLFVLEDVVSIRNRSIAMVNIIQALLSSAVKEWRWIMPADSKECIIRAVGMKSVETGVEERPPEEFKKLTMSDLLVKMAKHGMRVLPNSHECHIELRRSTRPTEQLCTLRKTTTGICACEVNRHKRGAVVTHSCASYYGSSVLASQAWSLAHLFPRNKRVWTIGDSGGRIGVVLGHAGLGPSFISDPSPRKLHSHQINNGPLELFNDRCQESYERLYYIKSLGKSVLTMPSEDPLEIVVVSCKKQHLQSFNLD